MSWNGPGEASVSEIREALESGEATSAGLVEWYANRIRDVEAEHRLGAVIELNPEAAELAARLDDERRSGRSRGPLHGIPVLLKDNIDTGDRMLTTAGSLALADGPARRDSTIAARLREAGALLLGKTNLSEWANIRSEHSSSGWSGRGGQCRNPHVLDRSPCGSSSGSAAAVAADLAPLAVGTETDGSIVCPSAICGVVGIKPTVGLVSRFGVIPISHSQDTPGSHARSVEDAALLLTALAGRDEHDTATHSAPAPREYAAECSDGSLAGVRIGVARKGMTGYSTHADAAFEEALAKLRFAGAELVDPADVPSIDEIGTSECELTVLLYELEADLSAYLAARGTRVRSLRDVVAFNLEHSAEVLSYFGQDLFLKALEKGSLEDEEYRLALETSHRLSRAEGLDRVFRDLRVDVLVAPTTAPAWPIDHVNGDHYLGGCSTVAGMAGYPLVSVPSGMAMDALPLGVTFMGPPWSEPLLVRVAHGFESVAQARRPPRFQRTLLGA